MVSDLLTIMIKLTSCGACGWDDSLVYSQLQGITQQDLENAPEAVFNAINGLRQVLASFFRYTPINREYTFDTTPLNWRAI